MAQWLKSADCSCRGPGCVPALTQCSELSVAPVQGIFYPLLLGTRNACCAQKYIKAKGSYHIQWKQAEASFCLTLCWDYVGCFPISHTRSLYHGFLCPSTTVIFNERIASQITVDFFLGNQAVSTRVFRLSKVNALRIFFSSSANPGIDFCSSVEVVRQESLWQLVLPVLSDLYDFYLKSSIN